jgi:ribose 5-phosphate isomerase A
VIVVDESKLVDQLGSRCVIPVEVVPFSADLIIRQLEKWGGSAGIRQLNGEPFVSDNGNTVVDWAHGPIDNPAELESRIKALTGVVDSGIFAGVAKSVIAASATGIRTIEA